MTLPDKCTCARGMDPVGPRPPHEKKKEHAAVYLYSARAREIVRKGGLQQVTRAGPTQTVLRRPRVALIFTRFW